MKCVFNAQQNKHYPKSYLVNGVREANPESPQRVDLLLEGAAAAGMPIAGHTSKVPPMKLRLIFIRQPAMENIRSLSSHRLAFTCWTPPVLYQAIHGKVHSGVAGLPCTPRS